MMEIGGGIEVPETNMDRWTSGADYDQWMGRWSRLLAQDS